MYGREEEKKTVAFSDTPVQKFVEYETSIIKMKPVLLMCIHSNSIFYSGTNVAMIFKVVQ